MDPKKQQDPKQQTKPQPKSTSDLIRLIDKNETIFQSLKSDLMGQLTSYEAAFSRDHNKYTEQRDFDHFQKYSKLFVAKGKDFMDRLSQIKNNCAKVIKNLPQQENIIPTQSTNSFDMFVDQQVDSTLEYKMKGIEYEAETHKPFQNQFYEFQID